jgi:hypothetical protein
MLQEAGFLCSFVGLHKNEREQNRQLLWTRDFYLKTGQDNAGGLIRANCGAIKLLNGV